MNQWIGAVIGAFVGSVTTGIFAFVTRKYQLRHEREKMLIETNFAVNKEKTDRLVARKEELFNLLQNLRSGFSLTQNYRMDQTDISLKEYDIHYEKMNQIALRAELLAYLYFPEFIEEVKNVYSLTNLIWGQQQNYFGYAKENKQNRQIILDNIVRDSSNLENKCLSIMEALSSSDLYSEDARPTKLDFQEIN